MPDQKLLDYISQQLKSGLTQEAIKKTLSGVGWQQSFIDEAFNFLSRPKIEIPIPNVSQAVTAKSEPIAEKQAQTPAAVTGQPAAKQEPVIKPEANVSADSAKPAPKEEPFFPFKIQPVPQAGKPVLENVPSGQKIETVAPTATPSQVKPAVTQNVSTAKTAAPSVSQAAAPAKPAAAGDVPKLSELDMAFEKNFISSSEPAAAASVPAAVPGDAIKIAPAAPDIFNETGGEKKDVFKPDPADFSDIDSALAEETKGKKADAKPDQGGKKNKKGHLFLFIMLGIVGIVLLTGAAYAYFVYFMQPTKDTIMQKMAQASDSVKTAEMSGKVTITVPSSKNEAQPNPVNIGLEFSGVIDATDSENLLSSMIIGETDNVSAGGNSAEIEIINAGGSAYLKITNIVGQGESELLPYQNQWIKFEGAKVPQQLASVYPIYDKIAASAGIEELDLGQLAKIFLASNKADTIQIGEKKDNEIIGTDECFHYGFTANKDALKHEVTVALGAAIADAERYTEVIDKAAITGEIWIAKKDYHLCQISYNAVYENSEANSAKITIDVAGTGYNFEAAIAAPEQYRLGNEIFYEVTTKNDLLAKGKLASQNDALRKSDMRMFFEAQKAWFVSNKRFYTCSAAAGDCLGRPLNLPDSIGDYLNSKLSDPDTGGGTVCGQDFVYCGLDNSKNQKSFCYYAKLSDGTFITASPYGNFIRETAPVTFKDCQQGTLVE